MRGALQVFVLGGSWSGPADVTKDAEIYDPTVGKWSNLPGVQAAFILTDDPEDKEGVYRADNYGMFHSWSDGTGTTLPHTVYLVHAEVPSTLKLLVQEPALSVCVLFVGQF